MVSRLLLAALVASSMVWAQAPAADVVVFNNGERVMGKLLRSNGSSVTFHSDTLGDITFDWSKVKELDSSQSFAVLPKNVHLTKHADTSAIPEGKIAVADQKITVTPAAGQPKTVAVADADHLVDKAGFDNEVEHNPRFFADWGGTITAGASLVEATQQSRSFNTAINLVRLVPDVDWLRRRNRTIVDFNAAYGTLKQPATPTVKTQILHADIERDEYLSPAFFAFAEAAFDHNFSQGLDLQQAFGGGLGWSAIKRANESLDLKAGITYVRQSFAAAAAEQDLLGSVFEEDFSRGLRRGIKFNQQLIVTPAWNNTDAVSAIGNALLTVPVYKRLNFSLGTIDNYLHDPPPGFKKNSFQATMGLTYALR
ncbi:MAG TPA: DUF481 domain-containing protein [Bryobacteraceae bacterium]|jgi:hypothetical protein|nr:DUF481 domain-containing protein [Bryobacteraceae bacterium]